MAGAIDLVSSWTDRLVGRLYRQFRDEPTWQQWAALLGRQFDDLETAFQSLLTMTSIDSSEGVQLDIIGRIVGQPRGGQVDATYRRMLRAQVLALKSEGTVAHLVAVLRAFLGSTASLIYSPSYPAGYVLTISLPLLTTALATLAVGFLRTATTTAVYGNLLYQTEADATTFFFDTCACLTAAAAPGAVALTVDSTAGLPATGSAVVAISLVDHETIDFAVTGPTSLSCTPLASAHDAGTQVSLIGALNLGLGFGDSTTPATGGTWAGALSTT